jgi:hypothetical protein
MKLLIPQDDFKYLIYIYIYGRDGTEYGAAEHT